MSHASDAGDRGRALRLQMQDVLFLQPALSGSIQSQSGAVPTPRQIGNERFEIPNFKCDLHVPHASGSPPDGTWCVSEVRNGARAGNGDRGGRGESGTYRHDAAILDCRRFRSEEHTSELQSLTNLVCRLLLEKKKKTTRGSPTPRVRNKH